MWNHLHFFHGSTRKPGDPFRKFQAPAPRRSPRKRPRRRLRIRALGGVRVLQPHRLAVRLPQLLLRERVLGLLRSLGGGGVGGVGGGGGGGVGGGGVGWWVGGGGSLISGFRDPTLCGRQEDKSDASCWFLQSRELRFVWQEWDGQLSPSGEFTYVYRLWSVKVRPQMTQQQLARC